MVYKYFKNRKITSHYMDTIRNKKIMSLIQPLIDEYSPTFYLPFALMKIMICNDKKVRFDNVATSHRCVHEDERYHI